MKNFIFVESMTPIIEAYRPKTIVETGTHLGRSAMWMCTQALQYRNDVKYFGFDLFEMANDTTHQLEINGKGTGSFERAHKRLMRVKKKHEGFNFTLYKGFTKDTFTTPIVADLAYIDGGHSTETVLHDYSMVKDSRVIIFDDWQMDSVKEAIKQIGIANQITEFKFGKTAQAIFINR